MRRFDVCNGDADGLCSVLQWRLHQPADAVLVTGLKREIELLQRVPPDAADEVLVCDLSMKRNQAALARLLGEGVHVRYFDHHAAGEIPDHDLLEAHLDFGSEVCTSLLMDRHLGGSFRPWAIVGAYGDEMGSLADRLCESIGIGAEQGAALRRLGQAINYNAYGEDAGDVWIAPARLYRIMERHADPFGMVAQEPVVEEIERRRSEDLGQALSLLPEFEDVGARVVLLPEAAWSRRVIGCLANEMARAHPRQAQAALVKRRAGGFAVSVRAPRSAPTGASRVCERFGGTGRAAAAGIDILPEQDLGAFIAAFSQAKWAAAS